MPEVASLDDLTDTPHARPFDAGEPAVIRLRLDAGESVPPHRHPDRRIVLHVLSGRLEVDLDDETHGLEPRDVVRFDGRREVSPRALEDSEALVVLAPRVA